MTDASMLAVQSQTSIQRARENLTEFVRAQATAMAGLTGITWQGKAAAPEDFGTLAQAHSRSLAFGDALPVSDRHSEATLYVGADANVAFRYWHDMTHIRLGRGFDVHGEIEVARSHLAVLEAYGFGPPTIEYQLLSLDTLGQTLCSAATGQFPADQNCFVRHGLRHGLPAAIREVLRVEP